MQSFSRIHWQGAENELRQASRAYEIFGMVDEKCDVFSQSWCVFVRVANLIGIF